MRARKETFLDFVEGFKAVIGTVDEFRQSLYLQLFHRDFHSENVEWLVIDDQDSSAGWNSWIDHTTMSVKKSFITGIFEVALNNLSLIVFVLLRTRIHIN